MSRAGDRERSEAVGTALDLGALVNEVRAGTLPPGLDPMLELAAVVLSTLDPLELATLLEAPPDIAEAAARTVAAEARVYLVLSLLSRLTGLPLTERKRST